MNTNKTTTWERFADFGALLDRVTTGERKPMGRAGQNDYLASSRPVKDGHPDWTLGASWEDTLRLAAEGWREGAEKVGKLVFQITDRVASRSVAPAIHHDVCGDFVDVGRFCEGAPECMVSFHEVESQAKGKVVKVAVNLAMHFSMSATEAFQRGAIAIALCDALERAGRTVEIVGAFLTCGDNGLSRPLFAVAVTLKRAGDMIDADRLAFMLCHPAVARRISFALRELQSDALRAKIGNSYGYSGTLDAEDASADVVIPQNPSEEWILEELRRQGVEITD